MSNETKPSAEALTFDKFRTANVARCVKWHPAGIASWSPSDWLTAVTGELGELASLLKMRNRERDGLPGNKFSPTDKQIADELADVLTYLDLLAAALGVDLGSAAVSKFNEVSERVGFPDRIGWGGEGVFGSAARAALSADKASGEVAQNAPAVTRAVTEPLKQTCFREDDPERSGYVRGWNAALESFAAPPAQPAGDEQVARDAARYQWLREQFRSPGLKMNGQHRWIPHGAPMATLQGPSFDAAIDAALAAQGAKEGK